MFPESFVRKHLALSEDGLIVLDPFVGRGTTIFESLLSDRLGIGIDVNPVAVCVSRAKACSPKPGEVRARLGELEASFAPVQDDIIQNDEFFSSCFAPRTLQQILWIRSELAWRTSAVDCFIAAMAAGCLHGESHKSARVFSNRMPRTIATKPAYSVSWWNDRGYSPPDRDVFEILRQEADFRFVSAPPSIRGVVAEGDARLGWRHFPEFIGKVGLLVTSPPYLDVTHFREDQWLRVWFLGGESRPCSARVGDDRHFDSASYWRFLDECWMGIAPLLSSHARVVIRIGGRRISREESLEKLEKGLSDALGGVECREVVTSEIRQGQLRAFRPNAAGTRREFDFVFQRG